MSSWEKAQKHELGSANAFMKKDAFVDLFERFLQGKLQSSTGWVNETLLTEFFGYGGADFWISDFADFYDFLDSIQGKSCLDVGPCVFSPLPTWDGIGEAFAIEPLGEAVKAKQVELFGCTAFDKMHLFSQPADVLIPDLVGKIDGVIYCRNMLDHTPEWEKVLTNIGLYAAPGCQLLLWTDLDHTGRKATGHFNLCTAVEPFKERVEKLGFTILRSFQDNARKALNWGCVGVKEER